MPFLSFLPAFFSDIVGVGIDKASTVLLCNSSRAMVAASSRSSAAARDGTAPRATLSTAPKTAIEPSSAPIIASNVGVAFRNRRDASAESQVARAAIPLYSSTSAKGVAAALAASSINMFICCPKILPRLPAWYASAVFAALSAFASSYFSYKASKHASEASHRNRMTFTSPRCFSNAKHAKTAGSRCS